MCVVFAFVIRDISHRCTRLKNPQCEIYGLVSYLGLNPSVIESGNSQGGGALQSHGRGSLRALLIQASKRLLTTVNPLQKWGLSVALRRGVNKAAVGSPIHRPPLSLPPPRPSPAS